MAGFSLLRTCPAILSMDQNTPTKVIKSHAFFFTPPLDTNFFGHIMEELWKSRIYDPYLPQKKEGSVAIDIGANVGLVSYYLAQYFDKVYSLEPSTETMGNLLSMVNFNKLDNITPIQKALFMENGRFGFGGPTNNKTMKSLHMATWQDGKPEEQVEAITLEKLFEDYKIDHVNLLKLDVEGSEMEILGHSSFKNVADKIDTIIVERHSWSGRNPNQLNEAFKNNGFTVETIPNNADLLVARRNG